MSDIGSSSYSETDAGNNQPSPAGWPSGMFPNQVEGSAQANMGATKRFWNRINSTATTGGTNTAYTLSYAVAAAAYYNGEEFSFIVHTNCGPNPTLNISAIAAYPLRKFSGGAWGNLASNDIVANQALKVRYNSSVPSFDIVGISFSPTDFSTVGGANTWTAAQTFKNTVVLSAAAINEAQASIASAATVNIGAAAANYINVTGTTTITAFDTVQAGVERTLEFSGALTLTYSATSLILPGAANITTAAGDTAVFRSEGLGNWRCIAYTSVATKADQQAGTAPHKIVTPLHQQDHPSAAKAWVSFDINGNIVASYNVSSVTHTSTGQYTVAFTTPFSSANSYVYNANSNTTNGAIVYGITSRAAGSCIITTTNSAINTAQDYPSCVTFFGTQ